MGERIPNSHILAFTLIFMGPFFDLFDGRLNAVTAVGTGDVAIHGMVPMLDNLNRILDRVAYYLT